MIEDGKLVMKAVGSKCMYILRTVLSGAIFIVSRPDYQKKKNQFVYTSCLSRIISQTQLAVLILCQAP